jgi:hypothetical protein
MMRKQSIPTYILRAIRQRLGLDESDDIMDARIEANSPMQRLRDVAAWELGDPVWADRFVTWAKDCGMSIVDSRHKP